MLTTRAKVILAAFGAALATGMLAAPASAEIVDTPSCKRELAALSQKLGAPPLAKPAGDIRTSASCTAYRTQFLETVRARAVVAACRTGKDREQEIGRLDGRVDDINGAIAQACG
ncbi:MAG: hypothetical protein AB7O60_16860 [Variibacter sp.]